MSTTGTLESGPTKVGAPYVDYATGLNAAFSILSALYESKTTGRGVTIDVAMLDTSMMLMSSLVTSHLSSGWTPEPSGNAAWSNSPSSGAFETPDGSGVQPLLRWLVTSEDISIIEVSSMATSIVTPRPVVFDSYRADRIENAALSPVA
jgi:hypothetical protein